jgi:pyrroline-5-carboxylate reductase
MTKKTGIYGNQQAAIDLTTILVKHPDVAVHLCGNQTDLNTFDQQHDIMVHRTPQQLLQSVECIIALDDLPCQPPTHMTYLKSIMGKSSEQIKDFLRQNNHVVLLSYNIGLNALHTHATLWANKEASNHMREQAEQIIRHCGSLQWTHSIEEMLLLNTTSASITMLNLILLESINVHLTNSGITPQDASLFVKRIFSGCSQFMRSTTCATQLFNDSCEYLETKAHYLKIAALLKNHQFEKMVADCLLAAEMPPSIENHKKA